MNRPAASQSGIPPAPRPEEITVAIRFDLDVVAARRQARALAARVGFSASEITLIATAVSELARNILLYAQSGMIAFQFIEQRGRRGIGITARDHGPGIPDLELALQDGYSSARGLGLGLPGVRRLMDDFEIQSQPGFGTRVVVKKWLGNGP
ncbi:MAG TPA: anti-sigma regulatory factor [Terriglobales bacterium]|nr:anti-sigma regulatory factor [Terriglobales bacterium]